MTEQVSGKIVILIGGFARGGCERQAYLLAREMRRKHGVEAEVWALQRSDWYPGERSYIEEFESAGIPTKVLGFGRPRFGWVKRCLPVARALRENAVQILLPFTTWPNVVAGLTYRLSGVHACIWGERHSGGERIPGMERIAVRQYRRFAANSSAGAEFLAGEMRVPRERISYIPNGVETPKVDSAVDWRGRLGLGARQPLVVKVANITGFKDHATLLHAWKILQGAWTAPERPVLALAGYLVADSYQECERIVREAELGTSVRFLGGVSDIPTLLDSCDLTVFSSRREGMPNGVLECMAAGKAVVATDLPGIRDALGPAADAVVVPAGDAQQLSCKLHDLLQNESKRSAIGDANRKRIEDEFSVERMVQRHLNLIQRFGRTSIRMNTSPARCNKQNPMKPESL